MVATGSGQANRVRAVLEQREDWADYEEGMPAPSRPTPHHMTVAVGRGGNGRICLLLLLLLGQRRQWRDG